MLTTDHPASHYQLGVLCGPDGDYTPSNPLPTSQDAIDVFGDIAPLLAGEFVKSQAKSHIWTDVEIALMRRYLSQDPQGRFKLPENTKLREIQAKNYLAEVMGDVSQGVHECYWRLGRAKTAVALYNATDGQLTYDDYGCVFSAD